MGDIVVTATRTIDAPAQRVYQILANYREHHPKILPPAFSDFKVVEGGVGAGTLVSYSVKAGGRKRSYTMRVSEPQRGRVLKESDEGSSLTTTFSVTKEGKGSQVAIETRWQNARGFGGMMERLFAPRVMRRLYAQELGQLETYAKSNPKI